MLVKCIVCGKDAEWSGRGREKLYCSRKCRNKHRQDYQKEYYHKRIKTDADFYERRLENVRKHNKLRSAKYRTNKMQELAEKLYYTDTVEEVLEILEANVRALKEA